MDLCFDTGYRSGHDAVNTVYLILALWRSGDAEDCKSLHPGSIPGGASIIFVFAKKPPATAPAAYD